MRHGATENQLRSAAKQIVRSGCLPKEVLDAINKERARVTQVTGICQEGCQAQKKTEVTAE
jgi:hypothetical protein